MPSRRLSFLLPAVLGVAVLPVAIGPAAASPQASGPFRADAALFGNRAGDALGVSQRIEANLADVTGARRPSTLDLGTIGGQRLVAALGSSEDGGVGLRVRSGELVGVPGSTVTVSGNGAVISGVVHAPSGTYRIRSRGAGAAVLERAPARIFSGGDTVVRPPTGPARSPQPAPDASADSAPAVSGDGETVDVLGVYTAGTVTYAGGLANVQADMAAAISLANASYANTGIAQRLRLVGTMQMTGTAGPDLTALEAVTESAAVAARRNAVRADLVSLFTAPAGMSCGIAWLLQAPLGNGDPNHGYSVVDIDCAVGNHSFAHEVGHNLGATHDRAADPSDAGLVRPWAHGYVNPAQNFRTIMAYANNDCPTWEGCRRINYWSDPNRTFEGRPLGIARTSSNSADDAAVLRETLPVVARYRAEANGPAPGDFDGNGRTNPAVFRPSTGTWYVQGTPSVVYGRRGDVPVPADYNGDDRVDIAVFRPSNSTWYLRGSAGVAYGTRGDVPVPGDYNRDGLTEIAVYRPSTGVWYVRGSANVTYGTSGDVAVPGDYNGDGRTDRAVFRPSAGTWHVSGQGTVAYGESGDRPLPADYDGDGDTDRAVRRGETWFVSGGPPLVYGLTSDVPVHADYDGDGRADIAVWRPSNGTFYASGRPSVRWGATGDLPLPTFRNQR